MSKNKIIMIISIVVTLIVIGVATILIINKNNKTSKTVTTGQNMNSSDEIDIIDEPEDLPIDETEEPDASPTPTVKKTPMPMANTSASRYYIKVNNLMNTVTIYTKDEDGNYTIPVKAMVCSTGNASPKNTKYQLKGRWNWGKMFGGVYTQYETLITGNILFHSVPYLRQYDHNSLEYWAYDQLGTTCSAGCIRLTVADAQWIYYNCPAGTWVEFYSSSNPGPLGKPSAMKISGYTEYRGWDPTDPDPNNPWRNANIETPEPEIPETEETPEVPVETPTSEPTSTPKPTPKATPTSKNTPKPTQKPTSTPTPNATPTVEPSEVPTTTPTQTPTEQPDGDDNE